MKLTVGEAAELLGASEDRVRDWIEEEELPAQKVRGQFRVNRTDLLEWATERNIGVAPRAFRQEGGMGSFAEALRAGGIHQGIPAPDFAAAARGIVPRLPLADDADREALLQILIARGTLGLTLIGGGMAIPQVRTPIILAPKTPAMALCFLADPLIVATPDARPLDALFLLIAPTVRVHLAMLARLAYALKNETFRAAIVGRASGGEILGIVASIEEGA